MIDPMIRPFVIALADYLAGIAPTLTRTGSSIQLFAHANDEDVANSDCYSTLRAYASNPITHVPTRHAAIQCETIGRTMAMAQSRAELLCARLTTDAGPLIEQQIGAFIVKGISNLRPPVPVRRDDRGRDVIVFNFDVYFIPA